MTDHIGYLKERIAEEILNAQDYPTMLQLIEAIEPVKTYDFIFALVLLMNEGKILFDEKHNAWLYTATDTPKLKKLVENSVSISDLKLA